MTVQKGGRVSKLADTVKFAAIAFVVALALALGLILLMELMRKPGQSAAEAPANEGDGDVDGESEPGWRAGRGPLRAAGDDDGWTPVRQRAASSTRTTSGPGRPPGQRGEPVELAGSLS